MKRMIALRKQFKVFGRGTLEFLPPPNRKILAYVRRYEDEIVLCVANLSRTVQPVELDLSAVQGHDAGRDARPDRVPEDRRRAVLPDAAARTTFYWFRLQQAPAPVTARARAGAGAATVADRCRRFFMGVAWDTLLDGNVRTLIERESLCRSCSASAGSAARRARSARARFVDWGLLRRGRHPLFITIVEVDYEDGRRSDTCCRSRSSRDRRRTPRSGSPQLALARVTGARKGLVIDGSPTRSARRRCSTRSMPARPSA